MPDFSRAAVSIVIRSYNGRMLLAECLPSVLDAVAFRANPRDEIIVADDGSTDGTLEFLRQAFPSVKVARSEKNIGAPAAANIAFRKCGNGIIAMLDNDVKVEKDFLEWATPHFNEPDVFGVMMRSLAFDKTTFRSGGQVGRFKRGFLRAWENYDIPDRDSNPLVLAHKLDSLYGVGAQVVYRGEMLHRLGGLDPIFFPTYWDDTDVCYRAWKRGWATRYEPRSLVYHKLHGTAGKLSGSQNMLLASERNRLIFHWKNLSDPPLLLQHFISLFFRLVFSVVTLKKSFLSPFAQAVRMLPEILAKRAEEKKHRVLSDREILRRPIETLRKLGE